ncbi:MAG: helix-turn-helix domain-containing protein, partial [Verrucomicrobiae bacterium]|nr:helix-turn-helix domain-containing protein [Verrucomicrobiae bacterium]
RESRNLICEFLSSGVLDPGGQIARMDLKHTDEAPAVHTKSETAPSPRGVTQDVLRLSEVAEKLNCSPRTVRRLVKNGELRALPQLRHILIPRAEVERLLDVRR